MNFMYEILNTWLGPCNPWHEVWEAVIGNYQETKFTFKNSSWSWKVRESIDKKLGVNSQFSKSNVTGGRVHSKCSNSIPRTGQNWLPLVFRIYKFNVVPTDKADSVPVDKQCWGAIISLGPPGKHNKRLSHITAAWLNTSQTYLKHNPPSKWNT